MGRGKYYTEEYKNIIVELYNSGKTLAELNSNMACQNQQYQDELRK
ncbi:transposase [Clostridium sp. USBA 49]|nr:transposase [Clostridium sp. USBA 49]